MVPRKTAETRACGWKTRKHTNQNRVFLRLLRRNPPSRNRWSSMANTNASNRHLHHIPANHCWIGSDFEAHQRLSMGGVDRPNCRRLMRGSSLHFLSPARNGSRNRLNMGLPDNLPHSRSNRLHGLQVHRRRFEAPRNIASLKACHPHRRLRMHSSRNTSASRHEPIHSTTLLRDTKKDNEREEKRVSF